MIAHTGATMSCKQPFSILKVFDPDRQPIEWPLWGASIPSAGRTSRLGNPTVNIDRRQSIQFGIYAVDLVKTS
jgi:hypothetical protein